MALWVTASMLIGCAAGSHDAGGSDGGSGGQGGGGDETSTNVTTNGPSGTGGGTGTDWPGGCDAFDSDTCGDCLETTCCAETEACMEDSGCANCVTGETSTGCASNSLYAALTTCATASCGPVMEYYPGSNCGGEQPCYDYAEWLMLDNPCHYAPPQWTCDPSEYDQTWSDPSNALCQCNECGYWDPDCAGNTTPSTCDAGYVCNPGVGPCSGCTPEGVACA